MSAQLDVLRQALPRLDAAGIVYMVSGSVASSIYGTPRMTRDVAIVVDLQEPDVDRLLSALGDGCYADRDAIVSAVRARDMFNVIHLATMVKLDFIVRKDRSTAASSSPGGERCSSTARRCGSCLPRTSCSLQARLGP